MRLTRGGGVKKHINTFIVMTADREGLIKSRAPTSVHLFPIIRSKPPVFHFSCRRTDYGYSKRNPIKCHHEDTFVSGKIIDCLG
jgi:hypothetical protein